MLDPRRWAVEREIMRQRFPWISPFETANGYVGFFGHLRGPRSGRLYEVLLKIPRGSTPRSSPRCISTRALAITGGRTPSTKIRGEGSATTAPGTANGTRRGARSPTASWSPSITSRSRAHDKELAFLLRVKSRIAPISRVIYPVSGVYGDWVDP